jgi:hypothetical protein
VAKGLDRDLPPRFYEILDTRSSEASAIEKALDVSAWEARQWRAAAPFRLLKITAEPPDEERAARLASLGVRVHRLPESLVNRARQPLSAEVVDTVALPIWMTLREDAESAALRRELDEQRILILVSGVIRRQLLKQDAGRSKLPSGSQLEDGWLVHVHLIGEARPWEIDPRRASFEGDGFMSAHMRTLELVRSLSGRVPLDDSFRNIVPALAPGAGPADDLRGLKKAAKPREKDAKKVILDNVTQFREYSAWRAAVEREVRGP